MFYNLFKFSRGTICVAHNENGIMVAFKIINQRHYKEWNNCFSIL